MASISFEEATQKMGGLAPTDAPIPGQSLTASPDDRAPFERPPKHTNQEEAVRELFLGLTNPDKVDGLLDSLRMGTPVEDVAQVILFEGFRSGMYTPDLMLALIEPAIYLILAIAEAAGIDADLYPDEDFWGDDEEESMVIEKEAGVFESIMGSRDIMTVKDGAESSKMTLESLERPASVSESMMDKIRSLPTKGEE